ncbi:reverse transcriptase domain-containing protein [Tanacetum coccineum]
MNPNFSPIHSHDLRTMEELHKSSLIGRGGSITPTTILGTKFVLKNHMVQLLRQNCQFHGFKDEDANEHLDKYLSITQFIKQNGVSHDIINLNLFLFSLTHEAKSWFYRLKTHSTHTWKEMVSRVSIKILRLFEDHRILLVDQILTFYHGITMIDREKIMMAAGGNIVCKTPQEAYDLIENMTLYHFQWDVELYYDTTTGVGAHYSDPTSLLSAQIEVLGKQTANTSQSVQHQLGPAHPNTFHYTYSDESDEDEPSETTSLLSAQIEVLGKQIACTSQNLQHQPGPGHPHTVYYSESDKSDEDEPWEAEKSKINPLFREPVYEKPLDSLDPISKTFDMNITNPLFDFDSKFTLNLDNPIFVIQNEESDEFETETIMEECMRTRSQSRNSNRQQQQVNLTFVEPFNLVEPIPVVTMDDTRTMAQLLEAPTVGYEDAIVVPEITADNFELKHGLLTLVQNKQFFRHDKEDPHAHIRYFNKITSMMKFPNVPSTSVKLMLFPFSLEGAARIWLEKEPPRSIITWDDLDRFNDLLRACPHHGFSELHQLDSFYNALNSNDQDSLNSVAGGNFLDKMPRDCLRIIESKSKVRNSRNKPVVEKVSLSSSTPGISHDVAELKDMVKALLLERKTKPKLSLPSKRSRKVVLLMVVLILTEIVPPPMATFIVTIFKNLLPKHQQLISIKEIPVTEPQLLIKFDLPIFLPDEKYAELEPKFAKSNDQFNGHAFQVCEFQYRFYFSGVAYQGPTIPTTSSPPKVMECETEVTKDTVHPTNNGSTKDVQPPVVQVQSQVPNSEPVVDPVSALMHNLKPSIPYPSRRNDEKRHKKANDQVEKFYKIFQDMSFEISLADVLILMPKFASTLKALIGNKEKLSEMARTPLNEHCSAVILNKLPKKLGDPGKFLIPCDFPGMEECLALADLGASINLMPLSVWKKLSLPELTPTCMTLELADHLITKPIGIAEEVYLKVGKFKFPADFVVVDFDADPGVLLILGRSFLKTGCALIDVYEEELTLRVGKEAITFNLDQTSRYSSNYDDMTANRIDVIEMACEEYSQEVLGFSNVIASGNPTPYYDPIISTSSLTLTPFGDSDFLLEEVDAFLALKDDPTSLEVDESYYDSEGDILLLGSFVNDDPSPPPNQGNYLPEIRKELKICEAKTDKSSIDEPPEVELKDLPPHLEYAFLEGDNKLPVIIAKDLSVEEKAALIKVLKSHKRAIAWKLSDIKGINPEFCTHKILMEEDYKPAV